MEPRRLMESTDVSDDLRVAMRGLSKSEPLSMVTQQRMRKRVAGIAAVGSVAAASIWYKGIAAAALLVMVAGGTAFVMKRRGHIAAPPAESVSHTEPAVEAEPPVPILAAAEAPHVQAPAHKTMPRAHRAQNVPATGPARATQDLAAETALLVRAQKLLASSPVEALAIADEHKQKFADGALAAERELLAAQAWMALKQPAQAHSRLRSLLAGRAGAIYAKRAQRLLDAP